jgi:REP element-mobilizing transposase RayT
MSPPRRSRQLELPAPRTWGGRRAGAGRKCVGPRPGPSHRARPRHDRRHPVHVTLRARTGLTSLRGDLIFAALKRALDAASGVNFRILHFSVQTDHVHLIVEADAHLSLVRGVQGLAVRCARAINRAAARRGPVWSERYHARGLGTPREVRTGLVYVLLNSRKHLNAAPGVDPRSSGAWFDGWSRPVPRPTQPPPVRAPATWLAKFGWCRAGGSIDWHEAPAAPRRPSTTHSRSARARVTALQPGAG